jgi:hypothetical protein
MAKTLSILQELQALEEIKVMSGIFVNKINEFTGRHV